MMIITPIGNVGKVTATSGISKDTLITEDGDILLFEDGTNMEAEEGS